ncbi:hypothetical protein BLS_009225 [Venturia inaequalis]|uniref:Phospholipid/glycerol acyltransferase domain-containing protein n=1 Tax=Venturia inaequalis TaxID=5025 RepID=A0A8H3V3H0_VENIN|nr:hypothetical protein BLS_009225 [Venturia inaequalis]
MSRSSGSPMASSAPDLSIGPGDNVGLHPSGYTEPLNPSTGDHELIEQMTRFRHSPVEFLREVSQHVSGIGWRSYEKPIGQPVYYSGFSEEMKLKVLRNQLLRNKVTELAGLRIDVEEKEGMMYDKNISTEVLKERRKKEIEASLYQVSEQLIDAMICKMDSHGFIRSAYYMVTQLLTRAYHQGVHVSSEEVLRLRKVAEEAAKKKQSIIFLPSHRSHVDYVSMQIICFRLGLALPTVVAGDNLNFPLVGPFLQQAGAMYIRRSFGDDQLYGTVVQAYIDTLLSGGYNFECFIEGGRSRTGKLLSPKFGILGFLLDSLLSGRVEDAIVCPISTQYDKVIEVDSYISELLGQPKKKENLSDFLTTGTNILSLKLGRIDVRFHEPWSLRSFINEQFERSTKIPGQLPTSSDWTKDRRLKLLRTMGYKVLSDINDVSVVMPSALVGTVLLTLRGRGVGKAELVRRVDWLRERVISRGGRVAHFAGLPTVTVVERALDVLGGALVGCIHGLPEETFYAVDRFQLSFYRNMTIHLFILEALLCAALYTKVKLGGDTKYQRMSYPELRAEVLFLSQLFRGEFIFPTDGIDANLEKALRSLHDDEVIRIVRKSDIDSEIVHICLSAKERERGRENFDFYCFLIWPFIEASWLGAVSFLMLTPPRHHKGDLWLDMNKVQDQAQIMGKTLYHQGDLSYFEAVNKETLKNAYQRCVEEGIILVTKSRDKRVPTTVKLADDWMPSRDEKTGLLLATGKLWTFAEAISQTRREGKNRRDGRTVQGRVLRLADLIGGQLYEDAMALKEKAQVDARPLEEDALAAKKKGQRRRINPKLILFFRVQHSTSARVIHSILLLLFATFYLAQVTLNSLNNNNNNQHTWSLATPRRLLTLARHLNSIRNKRNNKFINSTASFVPSKYQAQLAPQYAPQPKSDRELNLIQSEYGIQMARQEVGNDKAAAATKPATSVHKGAQPAVAKSKPIAIAPAQTKPAASKAKPATQAKAKVAPKAAAKPAPEVAPELAPETKITGAQHKKVARFDWLLRTFLNSLNAIYDEFGGIPDQIKIVDDGLGRHHAQAVVEGYTGEVDDEEGFVDPTPQIDVNKLLIANSWDGSKRLKGLNIPEPMPHSVKLMTTEYSNQGLRPQPPQYAIDADGTVQLAEPVYQKPEHVLQILDHLQNSPLGFASDSSAPATPNISVKDGKVTLEAAQWDVVKDCLSVVHYMNDYSKIGQVDMYREARASWIRMFGWAPGIDEMIQAKQRAHEFREEKGLHTHALATRIWIADEKGARERRDCAVYQPEEMFATPEAPTTAHVSHVSQAPLTQPGPALAKNHITPASELAGKPDDSATGKAEIVVLKAAINANGKAFIPGRTAKGPILPSMAAHTMIYHPPRQASAAPSSSSRTTVVIDLSNDEDAGDIDAAQEEKTGHHPVSNPTTPELVDPPMPTRDLVLHPYADVQEVSRKRKVSPNSPTSSPGASKRQAMGSGAHLKDNGGAQGSGGLGSTGIGGFPGVANDVGVYLRWEEARNGIKKEKHVARRKAGESLMIGQPGHS